MTRGLHWFRNDLRLRDNTALDALAARAEQWLPVFVLDPRLLRGPRAGSPRLRFLLDCLGRLGRDLEKRGHALLVREGRPERVLPRLLHDTGARLLSFNEDATPFARRRDAAVRRAVERGGGEVVACRDRVVFGVDEVRTASGGAYSVYTPYRKAWWRRWIEEPRLPAPSPPPAAPDPGLPGGASPRSAGARARVRGARSPYRRRAGGPAASAPLPGRRREALSRGPRPTRPRRDVAALALPPLRRDLGRASASSVPRRRPSPSRRCGAASPSGSTSWSGASSTPPSSRSIPGCCARAIAGSTTDVVWNDDAEGFEAWCEGRTGYPIVDAGMRQLRATGWMHNRVRMIVASFLTKDLLIDWREGERFFFEHLVDGDPASNNGGWQWAASTGTDAQPYFRIFNPVSQGRRWDPQGRYVRRWVPELRGRARRARARALAGGSAARRLPAAARRPRRAARDRARALPRARAVRLART